jgi:hypothetical protein
LSFRGVWRSYDIVHGYLASIYWCCMESSDGEAP